MQQFHLGSMESSAAAAAANLIRRQQDEQQQFLATRLLLQQQQQDHALLSSMGAASSSNRLGLGSHLLSKTAASRAGLEQVSAILQQQRSQQQEMNMLRAQLGFLNQGMDVLSNAGAMGILQQQQQRQLQDLPPFADQARIGDAPSRTKSSNSQQDANTAYYDASKRPDPEYEEGEDESDDDEELSRRPKGGIIEPFPSKLFRMIDEAESEGHDDIISFFSHGRAFAIHKPRGFISQLMPKYFSTCRMSSFQRQLNLCKCSWVTVNRRLVFSSDHRPTNKCALHLFSLLSDGFRRITEGRDKGGYFHEFFLKGRKGLCKKIKRKKVPKMPEHNLSARVGGTLFNGNPLNLVGSSMGAPNMMPNLVDTANLYQLQMLAAAQGNGFGGLSGFPGLGAGLGAAGVLGSGIGRIGSLGDSNSLSTILGNSAAAIRNPSMTNPASLLDQKQLLAQLQQQLQQQQQSQGISSTAPRGAYGAPGGMMPPTA